MAAGTSLYFMSVDNVNIYNQAKGEMDNQTSVLAVRMCHLPPGWTCERLRDTSPQMPVADFLILEQFTQLGEADSVAHLQAHEDFIAWEVCDGIRAFCDCLNLLPPKRFKAPGGTIKKSAVVLLPMVKVNEASSSGMVEVLNTIVEMFGLAGEDGGFFIVFGDQLTCERGWGVQESHADVPHIGRSFRQIRFVGGDFHGVWTFKKGFFRQWWVSGVDLLDPIPSLWRIKNACFPSQFRWVDGSTRNFNKCVEFMAIVSEGFLVSLACDIIR